MAEKLSGRKDLSQDDAADYLLSFARALPAADDLPSVRLFPDGFYWSGLRRRQEMYQERQQEIRNRREYWAEQYEKFPQLAAT